MGHYLISFSVYTVAMVGVILLALFVFKAFSNKCFSKKSSLLKVEDSMSLSTRKTLYVVSAGAEKFLIAADLERTSLISKLEDTKAQLEVLPSREDKSLKLKSFDGVESISEFASLIDFPTKRASKGPMMKELAQKVRSL